MFRKEDVATTVSNILSDYRANLVASRLLVFFVFFNRQQFWILTKRSRFT